MREKINLRGQINGTLTIYEGFKKFIAMKKAVKLSDRTIEYYENCYKRFTEYCDPQTPAGEITRETVIGYLIHINENKPNLSDQTVASYMRGTKPYIKYLIDSGNTKNFDFPVVKKSEPLKETYTDAELDKLLVKPDIEKCKFSEYRDWVIICHILATGNRVGTICGIKNCDVDIGNREINLRVVKNRKAYIVPISTKYAKVLKEYMSYRGGEPDDYLFCNVYQDPLTVSALESSISRFNLVRGVSRSSVHAFRYQNSNKIQTF
jgi:integrase/recombinase XerD